MNLVGVVSWFDEQPSMLATAITGLARVVDHVVAVDGAYALYPRCRARSHVDQSETILRTCEAAGVGCTVHRPSDVWHGNEIEKRQFAADMCAPLKPDWLLIWDADYHLLQAHPDEIRRTLAETPYNVASYTILDTMDLLADEQLAKHARRVEAVSEFTTRTRDVLRWTDDLTWGPTHYHIRGTYQGETQWLRGADVTPSGEAFVHPTQHLDADLVVYHRRNERTKLRLSSQDTYYHAREATAIERYDSEELLRMVGR